LSSGNIPADWRREIILPLYKGTVADMTAAKTSAGILLSSVKGQVAP